MKKSHWDFIPKPKAEIDTTHKIIDALDPLKPKERRQVISTLSAVYRDRALTDIPREEQKLRGLKLEQLRLQEEKRRLDLELARSTRKILLEFNVDTSFKHASDIENLMMAYLDVLSIVEQGKQISEASPAMALTSNAGAIVEQAETSASFLLEHCHQKHLAGFADWGQKWKASSFARMACGHKLTAALMLTNAPEDVEIQSPWEAWSLYVPNGMLIQNYPAEERERIKKEANEAAEKYGWDNPVKVSFHLQATPNNEPVPGGFATEIVRIWIRGSEPIAILVKLPSGCTVMALDKSQPVSSHLQSPSFKAIRNYVRGVCLALNPQDVERHRKGTWGPKSGKKRTGKEPAAGVEYELGSPVSIDLRDALKEFLTGKRTGHGKSPSVQFLVRGHWRHQAYGPLRADRKWKWIEPFWKGPEEARVLLRAHVFRDQHGKPIEPPASPEKT